MKKILLVLICVLLIGVVSAESPASGSTVYPGDVISWSGSPYPLARSADSSGCNATVMGYSPRTVPAGYSATPYFYVPLDDGNSSCNDPAGHLYSWNYVDDTIPPVAAFSGTPLSGASPLTITFTDASTSAPNAWYWEITTNFDSSVTTDTAQNPTFTFYDSGVYSVSLTATNDVGSDTETKNAYFSVGTQYTQIFQAIDVDALTTIPGVLVTTSDGLSGTTDANGRVTISMWNGNRTASGSKTGYTSPGPVVFTANSNGQIVNVPMEYAGVPTPVTTSPTPVPGAPVASFTYGGNIGTLPRTVTLTSTSTGSPTLYSWWYYPPGSASPFALSSTTGSATFDALEAGVYSAFLYVENALGSDVYSTVIVVQETATPTVTVTTIPVTITVTPTSAGGGTVSWDKLKYVAEEVATITYVVENSLWIPSGYDYQIKIKNDGGTTVTTLPIDKSVLANRASTKTVTLTAATYPNRRYYAVLEMISTTDHGVITLADDYMETEGYVSLSGYVLDGDTAAPISGATVTIVQQARTKTSTTNAAGYWSSSNNWVTGYPFTRTATKSAYVSEVLPAFTPNIAKEYTGNNFTLWSEDIDPGTCEGAPWEARYGQSLVTLNDNSVLMVGGQGTPMVMYDDVWRSTNYGSDWTRMNASIDHVGRMGHATVVLPDDSIVLMGGDTLSGTQYNDVWKSSDNGATWAEINSSAGWQGRAFFGAVATSTGDIIITGGRGGLWYALNDTWRSTDGGITWQNITMPNGWHERYWHGMTITPDNTIVIVSGIGNTVEYNHGGGQLYDSWKSTDSGSTWVQTASSLGYFSNRNKFGLTSLSTGTILASGGMIDHYVFPRMNDVWASSDYGATWSVVIGNASWGPRVYVNTVTTTGDRVVLMGGGTGNDTWSSTNGGSEWAQMSACNPIDNDNDTPVVQTSTTGYVKDYHNSSAIVGATVIASNNNTYASYTTVAGGAYTVTGNATEALIEWYVSATGYYSQYYSSNQSAGVMKAVNMTLRNITPHSPSSDIKIRGIVRSNAARNPTIPGATIVLSNLSHGGSFNTTTTSNAAGAYSVSSLLFGGTYDVFSSKSGFYNSPTSVVVAGV